jgi:hypothetical protein
LRNFFFVILVSLLVSLNQETKALQFVSRENISSSFIKRKGRNDETSRCTERDYKAVGTITLNGTAYSCTLFPPFADGQLYNLFEQSLNLRASLSFS